MFSNGLKYLLTVLNFSPILLVLQLVDVVPKLTGKKNNELVSVSDFWPLGWFLICVIVYWSILFSARKNLSIYPIQIKSIKSVDMNINPMFLSYFLPLAKPLQFKESIDMVTTMIILGAFVAIIIISNTTFQYSPVLRLFFRLKHYEVQTEEGLYLIVLSREILINKNQVTSGIKLNECLILNTKSK